MLFKLLTEGRYKRIPKAEREKPFPPVVLPSFMNEIKTILSDELLL